MNLAAIDVQLDELAQAKPRLERAIELLESGDGGAAQLAGALFNLGNVYYRERDLVRALGLFERALAIEEETRPRHPSVAISLSSIGKVLSSTGQHAEARRRLERALDISEKELGLDHPLTATVLSDLASIQQRAGDDAGAREVAERAVMLFDRHEGDQNGEPGGRFVLAQTLIATGGSHDRARREAEKALEQYRALADARNADRVRQWLAEHDEATRASRASARNGTGRRRSGQQ